MDISNTFDCFVSQISFHEHSFPKVLESIDRSKGEIIIKSAYPMEIRIHISSESSVHVTN